jgi:hypothetical protein
MSKGWTQADISKKLEIHPSTISLDVQYLKEQSKKELETHIEEKIPLEYTRAMTGLNSILKKANETLEKATDTKTQLQTMALLADLYKNIMVLTTDGGVIEQSLKMIKVFKPLPNEGKEDFIEGSEEEDIPTEAEAEEDPPTKED